MKKNYAGHKYVPGLVLIIWHHHASVCCAPSFAGGCVGIVGAAVHCVAVRAVVHAGVLCVCCTGVCCTGVRCAGACCAGVCRAGVPFVVLACLSCLVLVMHCAGVLMRCLLCWYVLVSVGVGLSRRCGVRPIGIRCGFRWTLCPEIYIYISIE